MAEPRRLTIEIPGHIADSICQNRGVSPQNLALVIEEGINNFFYLPVNVPKDSHIAVKEQSRSPIPEVTESAPTPLDLCGCPMFEKTRGDWITAHLVTCGLGLRIPER